MSRGLAWFVGLMVAVVAALGYGVWWLGPTLTNLAFIDGQRDDAYAVIDLANDADQQRYRARYADPLTELVGSERGAVRESYRLQQVLTGRVEDEWQQLRLLQFEAATDLVRVLTSAPYRALRAANDSKAVKLGSFALPQADWRDAVVLWLLQEEAPSVDPLGTLIASGATHGARVVWDAPVAALEGETTWQRVVAMDFADSAAALEWLRADTTVTERTVSESKFDRVALYVFVRG